MLLVNLGLLQDNDTAAKSQQSEMMVPQAKSDRGKLMVPMLSFCRVRWQSMARFQQGEMVASRQI